MRPIRLMTATAAAALFAVAAQAQTTPSAPVAGAPSPAADIVSTARAAGQFKTFLKAAEATNLTGLLKSQPNLTVFAPTDAAFAALPGEELERLMLPENKAQLQKLLTYHIINARVDASKIRGARGPVPTVAGSNVALDGSGGGLMANNATIVQADLKASNGVIHVVDKVLSPTAASAAETGTPAAAAARPAARPAQPGGMCAPDGRNPAMAEDPTARGAKMTRRPSTAVSAEERTGDAVAVIAEASGARLFAAMAPVADTPQVRIKYAPLSKAGERSAAKGN